MNENELLIESPQHSKKILFLKPFRNNDVSEIVSQNIRNEFLR